MFLPLYQTMEYEINKKFSVAGNTNFSLISPHCCSVLMPKGSVLFSANFCNCRLLGVVKLCGPWAYGVHDRGDSPAFTIHHIKYLHLLTLHCPGANASYLHSLWLNQGEPLTQQEGKLRWCVPRRTNNSDQGTKLISFKITEQDLICWSPNCPCNNPTVFHWS